MSRLGGLESKGCGFHRHRQANCVQWPTARCLSRCFRPVDTDRKKRANFDREDGATRHVSGAHYGTGAHSGRSQREVIFCVE